LFLPATQLSVFFVLWPACQSGIVITGIAGRPPFFNYWDWRISKSV